LPEAGPPWRRAAWRAGGLTALVLAAILFGARWFDLIVHLYILLLATIVLAALVEMVTAVHRPAELRRRTPLPRLFRRRRPSPRLRPLEALEHAVDFAPQTAFDVHYRLRPHLVRIAEQRLARHGIDPARHPDAARAAVGDAAWDLIRPDRPRPHQRNQPGVPLAQIRETVERLEAL
jgi:hypothetical protein